MTAPICPTTDTRGALAPAVHEKPGTGAGPRTTTSRRVDRTADIACWGSQNGMAEVPGLDPAAQLGTFATKMVSDSVAHRPSSWLMQTPGLAAEGFAAH
jgi:hypothetical protein